MPALVLGILMLTGCSLVNPGNDGKRSGEMNMQQGAERADEILDATFAAIVPSVEWTHRESTHGGCGRSSLGSVTRRRAVMTVISEGRRGSFLGVVERHWKKQGFSITGTAAGGEYPAIFASTPDKFRMSLEFGAKGQAFFDVVTPCLDQSEVHPPRTPANGSNYAGSEVPYPDKHSDFWSATG
ncbi:hypothetical protein [Streptomyces sp. NPDC049585]|uniref:hypothetical protein n=1 Tax=Streptomyces sp. NPDC049585 TaxID=3155154 RepID=UPI00343BB2E1